MPDGSQWLASGTLYSKNMLISGKNRAVASTYFKADATAPFFMFFHAKEIKIYSSSRKTRERVLNKISNDLKTSNALKVCWRQFLQTPVSNLTIDTNSSIIAV